MVIPIDVVPATSTNATGSFPYEAEGPVSFQNLNFVKTCQTDFYYNASTSLPVSQVEQCYNATSAYWTIFGSIAILFSLVVAGTWLIAKRYR